MTRRPLRAVIGDALFAIALGLALAFVLLFAPGGVFP
jgi:hypothetical protein